MLKTKSVAFVDSISDGKLISVRDGDNVPYMFLFDGETVDEVRGKLHRFAREKLYADQVPILFITQSV